MKSFIFALGDDWKKIGELAKAYKKYVAEGPDDEPDLNFVQASDFLQRNGQVKSRLFFAFIFFVSLLGFKQ